MAFSDNLQFLRGRSGQTQEQLAELLSVSRQSVSKWESAQSFPEMETLLLLCELYHVTLDELLRGNVRDSLVEDTAQYDRFMNRFAWRIALAVAGIIADMALLGLLQSRAMPELMSGAVFMLILTVCVVTLVASGIQHDNFRRKYPVITDFYTQAEKDAFHQRFVWLVSGGVGAILFDVALLMLFFSRFPEREPYESFALAVFLLIVAGAVAVFIYAGLQEDKYKVWKYNRDNNHAPEAKKRLNQIGAACAALMVLAAAIYVGLGLALNLWHSAWWVFAVGGILCGVVAIVLNPYKGED